MIPAEKITARCGECGERFPVPTPERLGDRIYVTCPRCQMPLTGRWYGKLVQLPAHSDGEADER